MAKKNYVLKRELNWLGRLLTKFGFKKEQLIKVSLPFKLPWRK